MSNYDRYPRTLIPRGSDEPQTTFREEDLLRLSKTNAGGILSESSMSNRSTSYNNTNKPRVVQRTRISSSGGPRLPQRRYGTDAPKSLSRRNTDQLDSGLGLDDGPFTSIPSKNRSGTSKLISRCVEEDDIIERDRSGTSKLISRCVEEDDVIERDHSGGGRVKTAVTHMTTSLDSMPVYHSKSAPSLMSTYHQPKIHMNQEHYQRRDFLEQMETVSPSITNYDTNVYQKHLEKLQQQAIEQSRLREGLTLLVPNNDGDTGFHQAIIHNQPSLVSRLLDLVAKYPQLQSCVDDQNCLYQTALHLAIHTQQTEVIRQLIQAGASPFLQDHKGNTPLHVACGLPSTKCLDELLRCLHYSIVLRVAEIRNFQGLTCAHVAVQCGNKDALLKLKRAGVDIDMKDYNSGKTSLHLAVESGSFQLVQLLIRSCNADYNMTTYSGCSPLHIAAGRGQLELVAYLISLGANPCLMTDEGDTPYDLAIHDNVQKFLAAVAKMYYN